MNVRPVDVGAGSDEDADLAAQIAVDAGELLLRIRSAAGEDPDREALGRQGDGEANALIVDRLRSARPDDAVLSEESADDGARLRSDRVWIVDPLDGTREFTMPGRTDWAVHVALWERDREIVAAAVSQPALGEVWSTSGAPPVQAAAPGRPRIVVSDSRPPAFAARLADELGADLVPMGSAGAKAMSVLRGEADAYVHAGGQWEWDSAAPVGVVLAAGLHASRVDGSVLRYNQQHPYLPDLVICKTALAETILAHLRRPD